MIRDAFLTTARSARDLIASTHTRAAWTQASALDQMTVGALAGHLSRAITLPLQYLDADPPDTDDNLLTAAEYFSSVGLTFDLNDSVNTQIRERGTAEAELGIDALVDRVDATIAALERRLPSEPAERRLRKSAGQALLLDEYLVTRIVELAVHADDLAASIAIETPSLDPVATACALGCLLQVARDRHGDSAVLRAMSRRERDSVDALRVF